MVGTPKVLFVHRVLLKQQVGPCLHDLVTGVDQLGVESAAQDSLG